MGRTNKKGQAGAQVFPSRLPGSVLAKVKSFIEAAWTGENPFEHFGARIYLIISGVGGREGGRDNSGRVGGRLSRNFCTRTALRRPAEKV